MKQTKEANAYKNHARKVDRNAVIRSCGHGGVEKLGALTQIGALCRQ